ncbi:MAG: hypothetical protein WCX84_06520 [Syntrophales bacterium]|nr:hypothetical protein [Syntrophales bacterium]
MAAEPWHNLFRDRDAMGAMADIRATVKKDSPWFSGHFPGNPIVPGLAILAMVKEAICEEESVRGKTIRVEHVRRVRFRLPVKPDDILTLSFTRSRQAENLSYSFRVFLDTNPVCSGVVDAAILSECCLGE